MKTKEQDYKQLYEDAQKSIECLTKQLKYWKKNFVRLNFYMSEQSSCVIEIEQSLRLMSRIISNTKRLGLPFSDKLMMDLEMEEKAAPERKEKREQMVK